MLTKIGTASNYRDLFFQYMSFLTMGIVGEDKLSPWLIIDPRLDSFYGATVVVPMGEYQAFEDEIKIWVDVCGSSLTEPQFTNFYDDPYMPNGEYNNLIETLKHSYPNGVVEEVNSGSTRAVEDLYGLLQLQPDEELPDIVICNGFFKTLRANGWIWDSYVNIELNNLFTFCSNNNIKLYFCIAPDHVTEVNHYDSLYNDIESFISDTGEIFINLPSIFVDMFGSLSNLYSQFPNYGFSFNHQGVLVRRLLQEFMYIDRPEYYVSFEYRNITSGSYREFLYNYQDYQSEEFDKTENGYYDYERHMQVERTIASKDNAKNPFKRNGQFVAVGLHTSYDHKLWMCEQGGITCKKEADIQINDIDLLPFWQFWGGAPQKRRDIPVYPGTGCPWMTIAGIDISKYGISENNPINFYFTRDDMGSTITVRVCDSKFTYPDIWQSIEFGRFTHMQGIIYPLYVGGGSLPLYPDWWLYYSTRHTYGQMYNLSMKNPALANSNILHTTKFGKANLSNFRVMTPDGFWKDIYSAYQAYKDIHYFTFSGTVYQWAECVLPHTYNYTFNTGAELLDTRGKTGLLNITKDLDELNKAYDKYFEKTNLDEITVHLNHNYNDEIYTASGVIPRVYASWSRNLEQGLHSSGGKLWLSIPNGWQDRLWHYKFYYGRIYWEHKNEEQIQPTDRGYEQLEYVRDEYHMLTEGRYNDKMINDRLVLDFGKAPVEAPELEIEFPQDYPTSKDVNLVLRCLVHAEGDTIEFSLYSVINNIEVDFGDGNVEQFTWGEQIKHTYTTTGDYYINIYVANASSYYHCLEYYCTTYDTGIIYSSTKRNNVLKKFYLNPYTPDAIFINDIIMNPSGNAVFQHGANVIYLYNQSSITELYLPYLVKDKHKFTGTTNGMTWFTWLTIIACDNISDIYIFNDFVNDYSTMRDCDNSACLYISSQSDVNVYVEDKYSSVFVNNGGLYSFYTSAVLQNNTGYSTINLPNIDLYLYNKSLVSVGYDANTDRNYIKSKLNLHVPNNLLSNYQDAYFGDTDILSITGDIV
jgi:hypothetical protein